MTTVTPMKTESEIMLEKQLAEARETNAKLHRRLQKLEARTPNQISFTYGQEFERRAADVRVAEAIKAGEQKLAAYKTATRKLLRKFRAIPGTEESP